MLIVCDAYVGTTTIRWCPSCGKIVFPSDRPLMCHCGCDGRVAKWTTQGYEVSDTDF